VVRRVPARCEQGNSLRAGRASSGLGALPSGSGSRAHRRPRRQPPSRGLRASRPTRPTRSSARAGSPAWPERAFGGQVVWGWRGWFLRCSPALGVSRPLGGAAPSRIVRPFSGSPNQGWGAPGACGPASWERFLRAGPHNLSPEYPPCSGTAAAVGPQSRPGSDRSSLDALVVPDDWGPPPIDPRRLETGGRSRRSDRTGGGASPAQPGPVVRTSVGHGQRGAAPRAEERPITLRTNVAGDWRPPRREPRRLLPGGRCRRLGPGRRIRCPRASLPGREARPRRTDSHRPAGPRPGTSRVPVMIEVLQAGGRGAAVAR